ncbi:MAG: hypothetical protein JWO73_770 [Candidatus Taylorbacteria bacterium]|nr:hypothetical protein [Candidatus Taylorbacteria bacterium]
MEKISHEPQEESQPEIASHEKSFASSFVDKAKKTIGLAGVIGLGYFGGMQENEARGAEHSGADQEPQAALAVEQSKIEQAVHAAADAESAKAEYWTLKWSELKSDESEGKLQKHKHEAFDIEGKQPLAAEDSFRLYSMKNEKGELSYVARDERGGESFYIDAVNPEVAETIGRYFYYTNPQLKQQFKKAMDHERELNDAGLIEPGAYKDTKWP